MINVYQDRLAETLTVYHNTYTFDQYETKTKTATPITARVDKKTRWVKIDAGELKASSMLLFVERDMVLTLNDTFTVDGIKYHILKLDVEKAFKRINHQEVYLS